MSSPLQLLTLLNYGQPEREPADPDEEVLKDNDAPPPPKSSAEKTNDKKDPTKLVPKVSLGLGVGSNGSNDSGFFDGGYGKTGDFSLQHADIALMHDINEGKFRARAGGQLNINYWKGNENTFGSSFYAYTLGVRLELDGRRIMGWDHIGVLSRLGIDGAVGFGHGKGQAETQNLHKQSGPAAELGLDLNIINFNLGSLEFGADLMLRNPVIFGSDFQSAATFIGGQLTVRPSLEKAKPVEVPKCDDDLELIAKLTQEYKSLQASNKEISNGIEGLKTYLENHPKHPFNQANMRRALVLGDIVTQLKKRAEAPGVDSHRSGIEELDNEKVATFVKEASKERSNIVDLLNRHLGVSITDAREMMELALRNYPEDYDFWKLPEDSHFELRAGIGNNPKACGYIQEYRDNLVKEVGKMRERAGALPQQLRAATHLAGLHLGEEGVKEILAATVINIDTPSFKSSWPRDPQVKEIKDLVKNLEGRKLDIDDKNLTKLAKTVFHAPKFEVEKIHQLAKWMNGEGELPGEERIRKVLEETTGKKKEEPTPEAKDALTEFVKKLSLGIFGHTDSDGGTESNLRLSERRAEFVMQMLIGFGVDPTRLKAKGFGEGYPAIPEDKTPDRVVAKAKNRRIEFVPYSIEQPITAPSGQQEGHIDAAEVLKEEGGTKEEAKKAPRRPRAPAQPPAGEDPAPKKPEKELDKDNPLGL